MKFCKLLAFLSLLLPLVLALRAQGAAPPTVSVTLAWDPVPGVAGYRLYEGTSIDNYTNVIDVGDTNVVTVTGLVPGVTYYFAIASYDASGLQSPLSSPIAYTAPATTTVPATLTLTVASANQRRLTGTCNPGSTYEIQASSDLIAWTVVGSVMADTSGCIQYVDTNTVSDRQFYRLRQVPYTTTVPATLTLTVASANQRRLTGTCNPGSTYEIQASPDLTAWTVVGSVMADTSGCIQYVDTNTVSDRQFYRLREMP